MLKTNNITQDRLKELLDYSPSTGVFVWKTSGRGRSANGVAGCDNGNGYIKISVDSVSHFAHRLAWLYMTGKLPEDGIDHINGIKGDNKFSNLRAATNHQNCFNKPKYKTNTSGYKGVTWRKDTKKWMAQIMVKGKHKSLGSYLCLKDAHNAYCKASEKYAGSFARGA